MGSGTVLLVFSKTVGMYSFVGVSGVEGDEGEGGVLVGIDLGRRLLGDRSCRILRRLQRRVFLCSLVCGTLLGGDGRRAEGVMG